MSTKRTLAVGLIGYQFMGKAHSNAWRQVSHFFARYAQDWIVDPKFPLVWRLQSDAAGSGALGDIFSHIVDLARYLVGEFKDVCATMETFVKQRPRKKNSRAKGKVTVDDA